MRRNHIRSLVKNHRNCSLRTSTKGGLFRTLNSYAFNFKGGLCNRRTGYCPYRGSPGEIFLSSTNRFTFYSVKATCTKTTGIKLSIFSTEVASPSSIFMAKKVVGYARTRSPNLSIQRPVLYQYATNKALRSVV